MKEEKSLGEELVENKAVQAGGAAIGAHLGVSTLVLGSVAGGKAGVILAAVGGPVGAVIGGVLLIGGGIAVICKRMKK